MNRSEFPPSLELSFATVAEREEFERAAELHGMSPDQFLFWLFAGYQRTARTTSNVLEFPAKQNALDGIQRKPMARAEVKRVLLEAVRDLLEGSG